MARSMLRPRSVPVLGLPNLAVAHSAGTARRAPERDLPADEHQRLLSELGAVGVVVLAGAGAYVVVIALTRIAGVRALATMSSFDFAATVAVGSTLSATLLGSAPLAVGATGLALLFCLQYMIARLRRRGALFGLATNQPVLLMAGEESWRRTCAMSP